MKEILKETLGGHLEDHVIWKCPLEGIPFRDREEKN